MPRPRLRPEDTVALLELTTETERRTFCMNQCLIRQCCSCVTGAQTTGVPVLVWAWALGRLPEEHCLALLCELSYERGEGSHAASPTDQKKLAQTS